jgi:hypothetical protein
MIPLYHRSRYKLYLIKYWILFRTRYTSKWMYPLKIQNALPRIVNHLFDHKKFALVCKECHRFVPATNFWDFKTEGLYCSKCERVLVLDQRDLNLSDISEKYPPPFDVYSRGQIAYWSDIESLFNDCPCGGHFSFLNSPRCPVCKGLIQGEIYHGKPYVRKQDLRVIVTGGYSVPKELLRDAERVRLMQINQVYGPNG